MMPTAHREVDHLFPSFLATVKPNLSKLVFPLFRIFGKVNQRLILFLLMIADVVFIGHVDAGKSTMGGQLLALTGMVSSSHGSRRA